MAMNNIEPETALPVTLTLDDHPGPALRITRDRALTMVESALSDFASAASPAPARMALGRQLALAASVLLALAGGAAAARFYFDFERPASAPRVTVPAAPSTDHTVPTHEPASQTSSEEASPSAALPPPAATRISRPSLAERGAPEDLLQKANHLRAAGQFREAAQTYALVYERFPKSASAYVAHVAGAAIELEHLSNPTRARRLFEQALREQPHGALDLEVRQGLSVALRDLEDRSAEARILQSLVAAHPDSPAARRAQVRLREIGAAPQ
jgi:tetratricopeptide (TPR) repeat protein